MIEPDPRVIVTLRGPVTESGRTFFGARIFLQSPESLHDNGIDDDQSAITFWGPREKVAALLREAADVMSMSEGETRSKATRLPASADRRVGVVDRRYADRPQEQPPWRRSNDGRRAGDHARAVFENRAQW